MSAADSAPVTTAADGDLLAGSIADLTRDLCAALAALPVPERIAALNGVRTELHAVSPFRSEPVDLVLWVPAGTVRANDYNPNTVAPPEMRSLRRSILDYGYTQPIVTAHVPPPEPPGREVVDGFHRYRVGVEAPDVRRRVLQYLPVATLAEERSDRRERIAATVVHNRARGEHGVWPMADLVAELIRLGRTDDEVCRELGMDADEILRFKQTKGLPELFADRAYSRAWE